MPKLDEILIIDIEATCWKGPPPKGQMNDIIEIGITPLNVNTLDIGEAVSIIVNPQYSKISPFCEELTSITQEMVDKGIPFEKACEKLINEWHSKDRIWASYGNYDRKQFLKCSRKYHVQYPFSDSHINVKDLASIVFGIKSKSVSKMIKYLGKEFMGRPHRGDVDSWNIAVIMKEIIERCRNA